MYLVNIKGVNLNNHKHPVKQSKAPRIQLPADLKDYSEPKLFKSLLKTIALIIAAIVIFSLVIYLAISSSSWTIN
jgi:hypothetical protein